ncbi:MAG: hypothetical protein OXC60_03455 [Litoreibacter sp.]|nr:hypothetical protein [Litoreibacter sp.]
MGAYTVFKGSVLAVVSVALASCEGVVDDVKASPTAQLVGLVKNQPCVLTAREGRRLAGAYLRQPVAAKGYDPIFVTGRITRKGLTRNVAFDDRAIRRLRPLQDEDGFEGSRSSIAVARASFGMRADLPKVYDLTYSTRKIDYEGPLVLGRSAAGFEVPTSGSQVFSGRVEMELTRPGGEAQPLLGQFTFTAGYGSKRGVMDVAGITGEGASDLGFIQLTWDQLFLCGTRFVSSGQGSLKAQTPDDGPVLAPFQTGREPVPLRATFEATQFAPPDRPGPPTSLGGVFVLESDVGTLSAVFLSEEVKAAE